VGFRGVGARVFLLFFRAVICLATRPHQTKNAGEAWPQRGRGWAVLGGCLRAAPMFAQHL